MIDSVRVEKQLINYTVAISNFENRRDYVSLSHCYLPFEDLINQYFQGFEADKRQRLKCYKGYQMERDLVKRITDIFGGDIKLNYEISAFDGLVKGHPDFVMNGFPCEIKSVLKDDWIPKDKLPQKVYWQVQGYMLYMGKEYALVVYESRESGLIKCFSVRENKNIQDIIAKKMRKIVAFINSK